MVNLYTVLKTVHVLAAVTWLGGAGMIVILISRARRSRDDPGRLAHLMREVSVLGPRVFAPSSLILLITGVILIYDFGWAYDAWIILAYLGWAATFVTGNFFLGPSATKANAALDAKGPSDPETLQYIDRVLTVARIDQVVLALMVIDMVIKPGT
ncbi:MAG: DUF2269 family protein [Actinobacteria bacterium]|nr:DUF2269 family protein [Actinomycetota bacterium]